MASSPKYASSNTPVPARYGQTDAWAFQTSTVTGAKTTSAVTSATTVAASVSFARARSRFHRAWKHAAARAKASAVAGTRPRYALARMSVRAVVFDFNGTLSDDEPILLRIYQELFAEQGRPLSEHEYYAELSGLSEEEILERWLGRVDDDLIADRIARYRALVSDGSTVYPEVRDAVRYAAARVPVAICSGAFAEEIEPVVAAAGLTACVRRDRRRRPRHARQA